MQSQQCWLRPDYWKIQKLLIFEVHAAASHWSSSIVEFQAPQPLPQAVCRTAKLILPILSPLPCFKRKDNELCDSHARLVKSLNHTGNGVGEC